MGKRKWKLKHRNLRTLLGNTFIKREAKKLKKKGYTYKITKDGDFIRLFQGRKKKQEKEIMVRIGRTQAHKTFKDGVYKYIVGFQREKHGKQWKTRAIVFEKSPYTKTKRFVGDIYGKDKPSAFLNAKKDSSVKGERINAR